MWNKAVYALVGFLGLGTWSLAHVVPLTPEFPKPGQAPNGRATVTVGSTSTGEYLQINSDFYLVRKSDFDRTLSVTVQVIGANSGPSKPVTMFVTFLPGEREQLVAIKPITRDFFPDQRTFVRISSDAKSS
jgi:hypothetical protein